ncbi:MAG TPA: sigma-70 family RNA polymerase sigma factor, partial [Ktedonobacterales bacterium]|nr:sigma-70 family RNA polymerase sigma factor [Ktedonobacterales bacterium]
MAHRRASDAADSGRETGAQTAVPDAGAVTRRQRDEFAELARPHMGAMLRTAAALVGAADAEDAAQEALVRGWQAWPTLRDPEAIRPWLIRITVNICRDWRRGRYGTHQRLREPLEEADLRPLAYLVSHPGASFHTAALDLRNAVNRLDESLRVIVALRYYAGLDATEIGEALSIPASTVRGRLSRALALLRAALSDSSD